MAMTPAEFAAKIEWEGGVTDALEYGLKHTELDPDGDELTQRLRAAWAQIENAWARVLAARRDLDALLDEIDDLDDNDAA